MPADKAVLRYREWLEQWENQGWRIDLDILRAKRGDVAFAIPCPTSRTSGNWVLDPVPLMPAREINVSAAKKTGTGLQRMPTWPQKAPGKEPRSEPSAKFSNDSGEFLRVLDVRCVPGTVEDVHLRYCCRRVDHIEQQKSPR